MIEFTKKIGEKSLSIFADKLGELYDKNSVISYFNKTTQNSNIDPDEFPVIPVDAFASEESISFLLNNSSSRKQTETDNETVSTLSNLLENFPLALEYARAYVNKMHISFTEYSEIYKENKQDILNSTITSYNNIFLFKKQYSLFELNQIISAITSYSLFTVNDKLANTHGITQEFIRLQMKEDYSYQSYFEKALQLFSELIPQKITNSSERDLVN